MLDSLWRAKRRRECQILDRDCSDLAEGPADHIMPPVYKFEISLIPFKGKIPHGPFKVPPSLPAGFRFPPPSPRFSQTPRKRGYPSIRRRVPIANEKSCSVAFNSMCRATRATISTRSINRVSCARISISGCLVDEHLYSCFCSFLKRALAKILSAFFISSQRVERVYRVNLHFNDRLDCVKEMNLLGYVTNLMPRARMGIISLKRFQASTH